jgi:hypothetical protein
MLIIVRCAQLAQSRDRALHHRNACLDVLHCLHAIKRVVISGLSEFARLSEQFGEVPLLFLNRSVYEIQTSIVVVLLINEFVDY